jgi:hypothetical protein
MAYKRRTYDEWQLLADYGHGGGFEFVLAGESCKEVSAQLKCYQENAPQYRYKIQFKRVRIEV